MFKRIFTVTVFSLLMLLSVVMPVTSQAKTVVLVHGYLSNGMNWRSSGFTAPLRNYGYTDGGNYNFNPWGMVVPHPIKPTNKVFYTVELPSQTNLQSQEGILLQYLQNIYSQRQEPITLVGHSAGGVVARLYTIDPIHVLLNGLITIASPHLGTPAADVAYVAGNSPIGMMASMVGGRVLQDSRGLFSDLKEAEPNNFLYWMNHQPHPNIHFASIIRKNESISKPSKFDFVVPAFSQDMNNIWSLKGRSGRAVTTKNHSISSEDGLIVLDILKHIP